MDFTFIFQIFISRPPLTVRSPEEPVAHAEGDAAPGALAKSACEHPPPVAPRPPGPAGVRSHPLNTAPVRLLRGPDLVNTNACPGTHGLPIGEWRAAFRARFAIAS